MDSQGGGQAQSNNELVDDQSEATRREDNTKEKYLRIKNVFRFLIDHAPYLVDDKSYERCEKKSSKEQFAIKIDAIRKSLDIDSMEDVHLLVDELYKFQENFEKEEEEKTRKIEEELNEINSEGDQQEIQNSLNDRNRTSNDATLNGNGEGMQREDEEEEDPNKLKLAEENIQMALKKFLAVREERNVMEGFNIQDKKKGKKTKAKDKANEASKERKRQRVYWDTMTSILSEQKLSVWKALDKALTKYYQLLVDRQNLIEETGMLNQRNEELKTVLNQYLQAGVNQELQVPPTQVIRLDI